MSFRIRIESFRSRPEAEIVRALLEDDGIPAYVGADDGGGAYPMLAFSRGVELLVDAENESAARRSLARACIRLADGEESESDDSRGE